MDYLSDKDKDRIQKDRLQAERLEAQALREKEKRSGTLDKLQKAHDLRTRQQVALTELDRETAIALKLLEHGLEPERLDLEFNDLIRRSDIELQTLQAELRLKDEISDREHKRELDRVYQTTMMEITQETARLLDEQNKAIAIDQQETLSRLTLERNQHRQTLEKDYHDHQYLMERDKLLSQLKREEITHEETVKLLIRLLAKKLGLHESEVSREQVADWVGDFETGL